MGLLRFFLAFSVVNSHAGLFGMNLMPADAAVQAFYVISGFYMAMVLNRQYSRAGVTYRDFLESRVLRIAPAYASVLLATLLLAFLATRLLGAAIPPWTQWAGYGVGLRPGELASLVLPQFTLLGLDWIHFFALDAGGHIAFTPDFIHDGVPLWHFIAVPQAWSLAVELYFYLLAPFLVRRSPAFLFGGMLLSFLVRVLLAATLDWRFDPWSYRFFPTQLIFFLAGSLAFLVSPAWGRASPGTRRALLAASFLLVLLAGLMGRLAPGGRIFYLSPFVVALLAVSVPTLFERTRTNRIDRYLGELSYPLYVCHVLVIWGCSLFLQDGSLAWRIAVCAGSIAVSALLYELVDKPVDRFRHRRLSRKET